MFYVRTLLQLFFPNSLKHPALVHCADICWGVGGRRGASLQWSGCPQTGWPRQVSAMLETHCTKIRGQVCSRPVMGPTRCYFPGVGVGYFYKNTGALVLLLLLIAAPKIKRREGGKSPKSSSLDFLIGRLKKLSGNWLPSPQIYVNFLKVSIHRVTLTVPLAQS